VSTFEAILAPPVEWVADQLAGVPLQAGRRAVVLVAAERQAHAIRRHVCVERGQPAHLAGVLFLRPVDLARELIVRAGTVRIPGWEQVRRLRVLRLFESAALADTLRYFNAEQLRSGQGYVDAFVRTIADLEASGLDVALAAAVARRLSGDDALAADRLHDVAITWEAADEAAAPRATSAQVLARAAEVLRTHPHLLTPFGPVFALLTASPSTMLLRFLCAVPGIRVVFQEARPLRTHVQRWRALIGLPSSGPSAPATPAPPVPAPGAGPPAADSELHLLQRFLFAPPEDLTDPQRPRSHGADGTVDLEEYPSIEDEIEAAATWVTEQVAVGVPLEQVALIVPELDPYAPLLADRLGRTARGPDAQGVRVYVAGGLSLAASPAGMRLQGVLRALAGGLAAEATIRVVPSLRRHDQNRDEGRERLSPSRAAEIVYGAGIVGGSPGDLAGLHEWVPRLTHRCTVLRQLVADCDAAADAEPGAISADEPEKRFDARARHDALRWLRDVEPILPAVAALQHLAAAVANGAPLETTWRALRAFCERWLRRGPPPPQISWLGSIRASSRCWTTRSRARSPARRRCAFSWTSCSANDNPRRALASRASLSGRALKQRGCASRQCASWVWRRERCRTRRTTIRLSRTICASTSRRRRARCRPSRTLSSPAWPIMCSTISTTCSV
jgi:hypothetical protein